MRLRNLFILILGVAVMSAPAIAGTRDKYPSNPKSIDECPEGTSHEAFLKWLDCAEKVLAPKDSTEFSYNQPGATRHTTKNNRQESRRSPTS
jgi:hypothetical protein